MLKAKWSNDSQVHWELDIVELYKTTKKQKDKGEQPLTAKRRKSSSGEKRHPLYPLNLSCWAVGERRLKMVGSIATGKSENNLQLTHRPQYVIVAHHRAVGSDGSSPPTAFCTQPVLSNSIACYSYMAGRRCEQASKPTAGSFHEKENFPLRHSTGWTDPF